MVPLRVQPWSPFGVQKGRLAWSPAARTGGTRSPYPRGLSDYSQYSELAGHCCNRKWGRRWQRPFRRAVRLDVFASTGHPTPAKTRHWAKPEYASHNPHNTQNLSEAPGAGGKPEVGTRRRWEWPTIGRPPIRHIFTLPFSPHLSTPLRTRQTWQMWH